MDRQAVQDWLDRYVDAWKRYDPAAIGGLFSDDAEYRYHPWDEGADVVRGRDEIVAAWVTPEGNESGRDEQGTYDARYEPWAVDGDRAVAKGWSRYWTDTSMTQVDRIYDNIYLLEFDADARCRSFTELFMVRPSS